MTKDGMRAPTRTLLFTIFTNAKTADEEGLWAKGVVCVGVARARKGGAPKQVREKDNICFLYPIKSHSIIWMTVQH